MGRTKMGPRRGPLTRRPALLGTRRSLGRRRLDGGPSLGHREADKTDPLSVADGGPSGFAGDGGPAVKASLVSPWGVALNAAGGLVVADTGGNRIRVAG